MWRLMMILKGLPEFFSENRRRSAKGLPLLTWREFQRLKSNCPSFFQKATEARSREATYTQPQAATDRVPLLEAPSYRRTPETASTPALEPLVGVQEVYSEDYMEAGALGIHEGSENIS